MDASDFFPLFAIVTVFVAFPWIIFHYVTKWKTAATITNEDEDLLDELHHMARRLDERMDTIERLMELDNPDWKPSRLSDPRLSDLSEEPRQTLENLKSSLKERDRS